MCPNETDQTAEKQCINDLLYFINFKRHVNALNDVVSACESFYSPDAILSAKRQFFDVVGERDGFRMIIRRGDNPAKSNLVDIVEGMNKCDNEGIALPTFLSSNYSNIPHTHDGKVSLSQILHMIVGMKSQLNSLEKRCAFTPSSSSTFAPSSALAFASSSAPALVPLASTVSAPSSALASSAAVTPSSALAPSAAFTPSAALAPSAAFTPSAALAPSSFHSESSNAPDSVPPPSSNSAVSADSFASVTSKDTVVAPITQSDLQNALKSVGFSRGKKNGKDIKKSVENRIKTNHERNKNIVIGKKPSSGAMSWGGAPLTVDCYIGRVDFAVSSDQIKTDVVAMGIDVIDIEENQTRHGLFKSFKLVVKKTDFAALNSPEIWPEGVVFRRFRRPRPPDTGHDDQPNL